MNITKLVKFSTKLVKFMKIKLVKFYKVLMTFCNQCGEKNTSLAKFCSSCGQSISKKKFNNKDSIVIEDDNDDNDDDDNDRNNRREKKSKKEFILKSEKEIKTNSSRPTPRCRTCHQGILLVAMILFSSLI